MDQDSVHMVAASKVPMLKPENGNVPPVTKLIEGVETIIAPATVEEKAQKEKFNSIKDAKPLLQAIEKRFGGNAATKKTEESSQAIIYEPEVKETSRSSTNTQNVAFVSSNSTNNTNGAVNTAHGATTTSTQVTTVNSTTIDVRNTKVSVASIDNSH
ncbi:hypothetical protein Tco_0880537 [Tanacetum coccineum]